MLHKSRDNPQKKPRLLIMNHQFIKGSGLQKSIKLIITRFLLIYKKKMSYEQLNTAPKGGKKDVEDKRRNHS